MQVHSHLVYLFSYRGALCGGAGQTPLLQGILKGILCGVILALLLHELDVGFCSAAKLCLQELCARVRDAIGRLSLFCLFRMD